MTKSTRRKIEEKISGWIKAEKWANSAQLEQGLPTHGQTEIQIENVFRGKIMENSHSSVSSS